MLFCPQATNNVTARYVHCGQVYVIAGQSNAEFPLLAAYSETMAVWRRCRWSRL